MAITRVRDRTFAARFSCIVGMGAAAATYLASR
jgi:hypothetical protein